MFDNILCYTFVCFVKGSDSFRARYVLISIYLNGRGQNMRGRGQTGQFSRIGSIFFVLFI